MINLYEKIQIGKKSKYMEWLDQDELEKNLLKYKPNQLGLSRTNNEWVNYNDRGDGGNTYRDLRLYTSPEKGLPLHPISHGKLFAKTIKEHLKYDISIFLSDIKKTRLQLYYDYLSDLECNEIIFFGHKYKLYHVSKSPPNTLDVMLNGDKFNK